MNDYEVVLTNGKAVKIKATVVNGRTIGGVRMIEFIAAVGEDGAEVVASFNADAIAGYRLVSKGGA